MIIYNHLFIHRYVKTDQATKPFNHPLYQMHSIHQHPYTTPTSIPLYKKKKKNFF